MKALYVRELTVDEYQAIKAGLHATSAFTVRRCQILLMSAEEGLKPSAIAQRLRCSDQCVRDAIRAFESEGAGALQEKSRARHSQQATFDAAGREWLSSVLRQSPRAFGYDSSLWTLKMVAELAYAKGYSERVVTPETVAGHWCGSTFRRTRESTGLLWSPAAGYPAGLCVFQPWAAHQ